MPLVCDGNDVLFATQVYKIHRFQNPYTKETYDYQIDLGWQLTEGDDFVICGSPYQVHADVDVGVGPSGDVPVLTRRELWTTCLLYTSDAADE